MSPSPRRSVLRRLLIGGLVGLAVLAAADTGLWFLATSRLADEVTAWQARRQAAGWTVSSGPPVRAGWPLAAAVGLADPVLAGGAADLPGGLSWQASYAELSVSLLRPRRLVLRAGGWQRLRLASLPELGFVADRLEVTVPLDPGRRDAGRPGFAADLAVAGLRADLPGGALKIADLTLHADTWPAAARGEAALTVTGNATVIGLPMLPGGRPWPPGSRIDSAAFEAALTGPWTGAAAIAARVAAWRDAGGTLELRRLAVGWGALGVSGSASMAVDSTLQPIGDATVRLAGYDATLDGVAASGLLAPQTVQAVKGVLAILARPAGEDGTPQVELPVTLQNRTLAIGPFPLLRLAEWVWR